jgi:isopenicillin-N epimerase
MGAVRPGKTRLVVIDHVTSPTALVFPVKRIIDECAARGVDVLVDGAHAPGMIDLKIGELGAAYYAGNLHKWVCAPRGSAFLYVRPDRQPAVHPLVISHRYEQSFEAEFHWQGTRDLSAWFSIPKAIEFIGQWGWARVREHNHALAVWAQRMLCERFGTEPLSPVDGSLLGSMATVAPPGRMGRLTQEEWDVAQPRLYRQYRVEAPLAQFGGKTFVRVACQLYSKAEDFERLAGAIEEMAA